MKVMRKVRAALPVLVLCAVLAVPAAGQELLPPKFSEWSSSAAVRVGPGALEQFAGAQAPALREYGNLGAERRTYTRGNDSLVATLYRMRDSSGAYGASTFLRTEGMTDADLGQRSMISREAALVPVGNLLLAVEQPRGNLFGRSTDLRALVGTLYPKASIGTLPSPDQFLPQKGLVPHSDRYVLGPAALNALVPLGAGDWIGFSDGAEVTIAKYRARGEAVTLVLASFPTAQVAARRFENLQRSLAINPAEVVPATQPRVFGRRSSFLIALVTGTQTKETADEVLAPIRYEAELTWNEPGYSATDPLLPDVIIASIYGTAMLLAWAFMVGVGFGGLRVVVKKLLPGRVFDRAPAVEIIQLGLSSNPIEAKDFYT